MTRTGRSLAGAALTGMALLGACCIALALVAVLFGLRPVVLRSGSMSPTITTGSLAVVHHVAATDLHVGDIVTVPHADTHVTHRIVAITEHDGVATLRLRGDANPMPDAELYRVSSAYRLWFAIPRIGYLIAWLAAPPGIYLLAAFVALMLVLAFRDSGGPARRERGRRRARYGASKRNRRAPRRPASHLDRRTNIVLAVLSVAVAGAVGTARPSWAGWGDGVTVTGMSVTAHVVPVPANFTCGGLGVLSVSFSWTAVAGATDYTLHYGSGGATTKTVTGTSTSVTTAISSGTAWVNANVNYGSSTWTSLASNTRTYAVAVVSSCG